MEYNDQFKSSTGDLHLVSKTPFTAIIMAIWRRSAIMTNCKEWPWWPLWPYHIWSREVFLPKCRSHVQNLNWYMQSIKSYGQNKFMFEFWFISFVFWPDILIAWRTPRPPSIDLIFFASVLVYSIIWWFK